MTLVLSLCRACDLPEPGSLADLIATASRDRESTSDGISPTVAMRWQPPETWVTHSRYCTRGQQ